MHHRACKLDMTHTLTTYSTIGHFYSTSFTYDTFISDSFVFSTATFVWFYRSEDRLTEQSFQFWFTSSIVDRLWRLYCTVWPFEDLLWRCKCDHKSIEAWFVHIVKLNTKVLIHPNNEKIVICSLRISQIYNSQESIYQSSWASSSKRKTNSLLGSSIVLINILYSADDMSRDAIT
jgi:hypothetical protein